MDLRYSKVTYTYLFQYKGYSLIGRASCSWQLRWVFESFWPYGALLLTQRKIRVLELVDRIILRFIDVNRERSSRSSDRGYSLTGKTPMLHIDNLGSSPSISTIAREAQFGGAEHWRCLGCKFKSYLGHKQFYWNLGL